MVYFNINHYDVSYEIYLAIKTTCFNAKQDFPIYKLIET